jgi:hypothetical protein
MALRRSNCPTTLPAPERSGIKPVVGDGPNLPTFRFSSLKERAGVKWGFGLQFHVGGAVCRAWLTGLVTLPFSAQVPMFGRAGELGQGPGAARPRQQCREVKGRVIVSRAIA